MIDGRLLQRVAEGDKKAFEELFYCYKDKIFNTVLSYLQNREEAEEITQDVFLEIFRSAKNFEGKSAVNTWLYRIAINKSLDHLRYRNRKKRFSFIKSIFSADGGELAFDVPHFEHPGIILENKDNAVILFRAIDTLGEQQKTAYILTYIESLSVKEVSEVMKLSSKAVESLNQRAKAKLREELEKYYPERRKVLQTATNKAD